MAFDNYFADRIRQVLHGKHVFFDEKKMFGGLVFMIDEKMCLGLDIDKGNQEDRLMLRLDPEIYTQMLARKGAREMDFTGKPMTGFVFVSPEAVDDDEDLAEWIQLALDFNPKARKSKTRL